MPRSGVNSFLGTNLERILIDQGIEQLVITGAMAHVCIDAVTRAATDKGYHCHLIIDACVAPDISHGDRPALTWLIRSQ